MKNLKLLLIALLFIAFAGGGCENKVSNQMEGDYPQNYDVNYQIRQVLQYDPMNINGIDVSKKLTFFSSIRFTLHYNEGKITHLTYSNGTAPFSPFTFNANPEYNKVECELNYDALPHELRLKGTANVIAYFQNGEFTMPFQLGCGSINYKYTFTNVQ